MAETPLEQLQNTRVSLERVQEFDVSKLPRREILGAQFSFEEAVDPASDIISLFRQISLENLHEFPNNQLVQIQQQADAFFNELEQILDFDPSEGEQNPTQQHASLVSHLQRSYQNRFDVLSPLIAYAASRIHDFSALETEGRSAIQRINDRTSELTDELEGYKKTAEDIIEEVRRAAAEQGVSQQAIYFRDESVKHEKLAEKWRGYTVNMAIWLGVYAFAAVFSYKWAWLAPATNLEAAQLIAGKVLLFGVMAYMLILCARNFLSHTHNAIVNKQRQNALMTFTALAEAAGDQESKDVVLTHAAACIFAPQDTGYTRQAGPSTTTASPSIISFLQQLSRTAPTSGSS